ncbi:MAG: helix-turn-helix domain-containing protein [Mycobacteriales bacterium]
MRPTPQSWWDELEAYLLAAKPWPDPVSDRVAELVELPRRRTDITGAERLASQASMSLRNLQRLFTEYVGVGPKWVIQRFRILNVAVAHSGESVDWSRLAYELGFSGQAHLARHSIRSSACPAAYRNDSGTV